MDNIWCEHLWCPESESKPILILWRFPDLLPKSVHTVYKDGRHASALKVKLRYLLWCWGVVQFKPLLNYVRYVPSVKVKSQSTPQINVSQRCFLSFLVSHDW